MTKGEQRLRIEFLSGNNDKVQNFKEKVAHLINDLEDERTETRSEKSRLINQAQTTLEEASMWIIKAITSK